jgi:hypothetical protein
MKENHQTETHYYQCLMKRISSNGQGYEAKDILKFIINAIIFYFTSLGLIKKPGLFGPAEYFSVWN